MGSKGVKPDVCTFNFLSKGFVTMRIWRTPRDGTRKWEKMIITPIPQHFESLANRACEEGEFEFGQELCKEAISRRRFIGLPMMQRVLDGLVKESKMEEAKELMELGKSNSFFQYKLEWHTAPAVIEPRDIPAPSPAGITQEYEMLKGIDE